MDITLRRGLLICVRRAWADHLELALHQGDDECVCRIQLTFEEADSLADLLRGRR